ncbi:hypothetical protein JTB14_011353 [Gonioctena quinquepunctata]|nr:hypothetical protein JTB14_011353 [Gonioctena quinquepunctata]
MKEIQLLDSEQGKTHTFMVSDENYEEIIINNSQKLTPLLPAQVNYSRNGQVDNGLAGTLNDSENNSSSDNQNTPSFHSSFMKKRKVTENAAEKRQRKKKWRGRYLDLLES